nr:hypothetical protein [Tanacetum cinerariifolium]
YGRFDYFDFLLFIKRECGEAPSRIILFGTIPVEIPTKTPVISPVAPVVETTIVVPPTGLRDLIPYSDFDSDSPNEMISLEYISSLPATSPFTCTNSLENSRDSSDGPPSQDTYKVVVARWRSKVASLSSSDASPAHGSGHPTSDQSLSGYCSPATTIDDSPAPPRFVYLPIVTPRDSEAYRRWRFAPLSIMCPPIISESSSRDLYSKSYVRSSGKRCRSPTATMPLLISTSGALVPTRADLLLPRKRFIDSYSFEESIEEDIDAGVGIEVDTGIVMVLRAMTNTRSRMTLAAIEEMINRRVVICTHIANITRKPDKNDHKNGKSTQELGIIKKSQPWSTLVNSHHDKNP